MGFASYGNDAFKAVPDYGWPAGYTLIQPGGGWGTLATYQNPARNEMMNEGAVFHQDEKSFDTAKGKGFNMTFMDGHAKTITLNEYFCARGSSQLDAGGKLPPSFRTWFAGYCNDLDRPENFQP
jgi:prepilin-type processing-associated H-X9-DG protein